MGYFGPFFYYTIYEICSEKLQGSTEQPVTIDDCIFRLHRRVVCSATRAKPTTVTRGLLLGQSCGLWSYETDGDYFEIKIPILLDLLDSDQKKTRLKRATIAGKKRLDKEEDKDKEVDVEEKPLQLLKFYIPEEINVTYQSVMGYPFWVIEHVAREAWPIYIADTKPGKDWPRFLSHYVKNAKENITALLESKAAESRLAEKYKDYE